MEVNRRMHGKANETFVVRYMGHNRGGIAIFLAWEEYRIVK
jgi:hypothetical protein